MRVFIASIVSALSIVPLYFVALALAGDLDNGLLLPVLIAALAVSVVAICGIALPLHFILTRIGQAYGRNYALVGFLVPAIVTYVIHPFGHDGAYWTVLQVGVMGLIGASVAMIFWGIVRR